MAIVKDERADSYLASPPEGVRLFLIHGNDPGAITERARLAEQTALNRGRGDAVIRFGSDQLSSDPGLIADQAFSASLFGGEPVVSLRVLDGRHNVFGALGPVFERPPDAAWVIVEAGELAPTSPLRKAFESNPHAAAIASYHLEGAGLAAYIRTAADSAGLALEAAALETLTTLLGGDRLQTRGELEKLFLYADEARPVTVADVEAVVGDAAELRSEAVIDAALIGDAEAAETGLNRLRAEGGSFAGLAAQALRHLMQLQNLRLDVERGAAVSSALARARPPVFWRRRAAVEAALAVWPSEMLADARSRLAAGIYTTRQLPALEDAAISEALHGLALMSRRLRRRSKNP